MNACRHWGIHIGIGRGKRIRSLGAANRHANSISSKHQAQQQHRKRSGANLPTVFWLNAHVVISTFVDS
jgi:hypothetical protein